MSHPDFKHIGTPQTRAIEECSELIQALCKLDRFGPISGQYDNLARVREEIADVREALDVLEAMLLNTAGKRQP
jgi:hypothetical protein